LTNVNTFDIINTESEVREMTKREKEIKAQIDEYVTNEYDDLYLDFDDYVVIADMLDRFAKMELILKNMLDK
jgi:hypothetical protein